MAKKVKLGEKANSFFDPISRLKVLPGQVIELTKENEASKKVQVALRQGHLSITDESVTETQSSDAPKTKEKTKELFDASKVELNDKGIKGLKKAELVAVALFNKASYIDEETEKETAYTQEELEELTVEELKEVLLEE